MNLNDIWSAKSKLAEARAATAALRESNKKRTNLNDTKKNVAEGSEDLELYGLRVGDTVKAIVKGKRVQGDVIDIFPDSMEVELLLRGANAGRTITVDVRDTEAMNEQGVAEGVEIVDQDSDLDQQVFTLNVDGKTVSFTYWDYENNFQNPDIKDIYQQAREQLGKKLSPEQIKSVARSVFKSFKKGVAEGRFDEPLTGWYIVYRKSGNPVHATPSFETKDQAQKYLMTKMFANHQDYKVVHTAGVGVAEAMSPQQQHDFDRMRAGAMSRQAYDAKWKKPRKSDDEVIYGKRKGVAEGSDNIRSMIQQYEDMVELVYDLPPGRKKNIAIDKRDALEAQIEAMPGGSEALRKWAKSYNDAMDEGVAEGVEIIDQDSDLDQQVYTLNVDGNKVSFTYWDYENNFQSPDIKDIYQQAKEQLGKKLSPEQIKAVARAVFKSFKQGVAEATGNTGLPHDFTAVQPGAEVWYKGRFAGWTTGKVYDDPYGKAGKMVAFEPNPSEFPGDDGRILSLPYDEVSLRKSTSIGKLKGPGQGVAEGKKKPHPQTWHDVDPKLGKAVDKMSQAEKVKKGYAHPDTLKKKGVAEGSEEQVYKVVALDKSNALKKPTKLNVKASSIEDVFSRLAANDWYALSINGVEVVAGKRLKQGVAEAAGLYGPFTVTINTGERPQSRTKTKKFRREDDAILWAQDWLEDFSQYPFATAEVTDPDGNVVWTTDEEDSPWAPAKQGVAEAEKNPHTSALGKALYRDLSKEKKASPAQVQRNKERWAKRQAEKGVTEGTNDDFEQAHHNEVEKHIKAYGTPGEYSHKYDGMGNAHNSYLTYPGRKVTINTQKYGDRFGHNVFTKKDKEVDEGYDKWGWHTSVTNGEFMPTKYGNKAYVYLHDMDNQSANGNPQLVTVNKHTVAKRIAQQFGGKVVKTDLNTYRIVKPAEQGVAEGSNDLHNSMLEVLKTIYNGAIAGENMIDYLADELGQYYDEVEASGDQPLQAAYNFMMDNGQEAEDDPQSMAQTAKQAISMLKSGMSEAFIAPALSASNAAAEYRRQGQAGGGYKGRIDIPVGSKEDYLESGRALKRAAKQKGQHIEYGLSGRTMSVFSDTMNSDELDAFIDDVLGQGLEEGAFDKYSPMAQQQIAKDREQSLHNTGAMEVIHDLINGSLDGYDVMNHPRTPAQKVVAKMMQDKYENISINHRLHGDDDFEEIISRIIDDFEEDYGVSEGHLSNPGKEDSPVANSIIRRILLQRTDLLAKYGPEKVMLAVDEVVDFVGDVDEIGSSDVSGWIRHVERLLSNTNEQVVSETSDLAKQFMDMARNMGYNPRLAGTPDEERNRTAQMLKKREIDRANAPKATLDPNKEKELRDKLAQLKSQYKGDSWRYADIMMPNDREQESIYNQMQRIIGTLRSYGLDETIKRVGDDYRLVSKKGRNLGTYPTRAGAENRERQVQYFKHIGEDSVELSELSNQLLDQYKKSAGISARDLDKAGKYSKADKRFHGIVQATKKQFDNDLKKNPKQEDVSNIPQDDTTSPIHEDIEYRLQQMKRAGYNL